MAVSGGKRLRLGEILINAGVLNDEQLTIGLNKQKQTREPIGEILVKLGFVTEAQIRHALELQYGIKSISLKSRIPQEIVRILPESVIRQFQVLPVGVSGVTLAMVDPTNFMALEDIRMRLKGVNIQPVVVTEAEFSEFLRTMPKTPEIPRTGSGPLKEEHPRSHSPLPSSHPPHAALNNLSGVDETNPTQLSASILTNALKRKATEIIIEPQENETVVRYRIDGMLFRESPLPAKIAQGLVSRFKVLADLNLTAGQLPQSGVFTYSFEGRPIKIFINSVPVNFGQMMTLRLYDSLHLSEGTLDSIVLQPEVAKNLKAMILKKSGLILFNGPLGSWKTTLMYACLKELVKTDRTLVTVEVRAAYDVPGVCQAVVSDDLPAMAVLDAVVKQRPDVLMVPNLTDPLIANHLIQIALSGCLVLAGVNTTQGVFSEAIDHWKVPPRTFANALAGIVTQRVTRKLCSCKVAFQPDPQTLEYFRTLNRTGTIYRPVGCPACNNTAYHGQVGIMEVIACNPQIRELIAKGISKARLALFARQMGMMPLYDYASWLVASGHTSLEELSKADVFETAAEGVCPTCGQNEAQCKCNK
ncbi:MAG TPA: ATPase, T2SS/T4P/T4SS family [Chroococcales cyanobacterium]